MQPANQTATRRLFIRSRTHYAYDVPVQHSMHQLHLRPITEIQQRFLKYALTVIPSVSTAEYEELFGNW